MNAITPSPTGQRPRSGPLVIQNALVGEPEPGLIDLLLTLLRHRGTLVLATMLGAVVGGVYAALAPRVHTYTTTIEIGSTDPANKVPLEAPEAAIAKMSNAWLPAIEREHGQSTDQPRFESGLMIKNPKGTALLVLTSKATQEDEQEQLHVHRQMSERLMAEHRRQIQLIRTSLDLELDSAKRSAAALKDKVASLTLRRSLLQDKRMLTEQRLRDLDQEIVRVTTNRETAGRSINGQEQVLTVMMLDLQMAREKEKRDELQRQLTIGLAEENDQVTREEADLQRAQQEQDGRIAGIQARIAHLSETRLVDEPQRSQRPVGMDGMMIFAAGLLAGLFMGIGAVFLRQAIRDRSSRNPSAA